MAAVEEADRLVVVTSGCLPVCGVTVSKKQVLSEQAASSVVSKLCLRHTTLGHSELRDRPYVHQHLRGVRVFTHAPARLHHCCDISILSPAQATLQCTPTPADHAVESIVSGTD